MTNEEDKNIEEFKKKYWARLRNNFKDPDFVIKIWQQLCILAFLSGIVLGAVFTQNYYINQVNEVFQDAREKNGCFNTYLIENYGADHFNRENFSWEAQNISPMFIDSVPDKTGKSE